MCTVGKIGVGRISQTRQKIDENVTIIHCYGKTKVQTLYNRMDIMIDKCWDTIMQMVNSDCPRPSKCLCSSSPFLETLKNFPKSSIKWLNLEQQGL